MRTRAKLTISGAEQLVTEAFLEWHSVLAAGSEAVGGAMQMIGTDVRFRRIARHKTKLHLEFWIGSAANAAVQLNQPGSAGSEQPGTTIATDARGNRYVLRQGDLHGDPPSDRIQWAEFTRRTGLEPVTVDVGGKAPRKEWHVVARLDGRSEAEIRDETAEFIRLCWNARTFGKLAAEDQDRLQSLFGKPERGGWYDVDPALEPRRVLRVQGYVSECLERVLGRFGIELKKPRHAANYEVDGAIETPSGPILVEIKTGVSPADVYCGVGQLNVYPALLSDLDDHSKIILLPGEPTADLVDALKTCGVELHSYVLKRGRRRASAVFSAAFLRRCGVPERGIAKLLSAGEAIP